MYLIKVRVQGTKIQATCPTFEEAEQYYWDQRFQNSQASQLELWQLDSAVGWQLIHGCSRPSLASCWQEMHTRADASDPYADEYISEELELARWDWESTSYPYHPDVC